MSTALDRNALIADVLGRQAALVDGVRKGALAGTAHYPGDRYAWVVGKDAGKLALANYGAADRGDVDDGAKAVGFTVSTAQEDRDGDVLHPRGVILDNYARNPVVFFGHQEWEIPIGVSRDPAGNLAVRPEAERIWAKCYFDVADPDADFIYGKVRRGVLSAASVSFVPVEAYRRDRSKALPRDQQGQAGWEFVRYDLTEWSVVGVPANAGAIRDALDREESFISPRLAKGLGAYAARPRGKGFAGWLPQGGTGMRPTKAATQADTEAAGTDFPDKAADCTARKAAQLKAEGYPPEQAEAVAYKLCKDGADGIAGHAAVAKSLGYKALNTTSGTEGGYAVDDEQLDKAADDFGEDELVGEEANTDADPAGEVEAPAEEMDLESEYSTDMGDDEPKDEPPDDPAENLESVEEHLEEAEQAVAAGDPPLGAQILAHVLEHVGSALEYLDGATGGLEPEAKEAMGSLLSEGLAKYKEAVEGLAAERYPDHDLKALCASCKDAGTAAEPSVAEDKDGHYDFTEEQGEGAVTPESTQEILRRYQELKRYARGLSKAANQQVVNLYRGAASATQQQVEGIKAVLAAMSPQDLKDTFAAMGFRGSFSGSKLRSEIFRYISDRWGTAGRVAQIRLSHSGGVDKAYARGVTERLDDAVAYLNDLGRDPAVGKRFQGGLKYHRDVLARLRKDFSAEGEGTPPAEAPPGPVQEEEEKVLVGGEVTIEPRNGKYAILDANTRDFLWAFDRPEWARDWAQAQGYKVKRLVRPPVSKTTAAGPQKPAAPAKKAAPPARLERKLADVEKLIFRMTGRRAANG